MMKRLARSQTASAILDYQRISIHTSKISGPTGVQDNGCEFWSTLILTLVRITTKIKYRATSHHCKRRLKNRGEGRLWILNLKFSIREIILLFSRPVASTIWLRNRFRPKEAQCACSGRQMVLFTVISIRMRLLAIITWNCSKNVKSSSTDKGLRPL